MDGVGFIRHQVVGWLRDILQNEDEELEALVTEEDINQLQHAPHLSD